MSEAIMTASTNGNARGSSSSSLDTYMQDKKRYTAVDRILDRRGPSTAEEFVGGDSVSILPSSRSAAQVDLAAFCGLERENRWSACTGDVYNCLCSPSPLFFYIPRPSLLNQSTGSRL